MNASGKQSFYEIQLSNSSLIVAFLVAVGLGVAVFMLGVMVGRGQTEMLAGDGAMVEDFAAQQPAEPEDQGEADFFEELEEPVQQPEPAAAQPPVESTTEPEPEPAATVAEATPESTRPANGNIPPHDPNLSSGYVVQVKATPDRAQADSLQAALASAGFPAFVIGADVNGATTYRVRIGRYGDREDARRVAELLSQRRDIDATWITTG